MESSKKYYKRIDLIRLISCIAVLLYHINVLKGGYLAVCSFFVLSGYLSCISAAKKEKFSIISYYKNKLLHIYLPLIIIVFISVFVISLIPNINWLNLKPETTSVLFGYNNFWQLNANLDYFARHINSPFMHLWYIAILLQFDLVFPFVYIILKKIGDKIDKVIPCIIMIIVSTISSIYFYKMSLNSNIMYTYYSTFTRMFSLFFGLSLGLIQLYCGSLVPKAFKKKNIRNIIFALYLILLVVLFVCIDSKSTYFNLSMILASLVTCRLIDYGTLSIEGKMSIFDKIVKYLSSITYEFYLLQYPLIFIFQYIEINEYIKLTLMIILLILLSTLFHFAFDIKKKKFSIKHVVFILLLVLSILGCYKYIITEDHTQEMKELEEQLNKNEKIMQEKQEEYAARLKAEQDSWNSELENLEDWEKQLDEMVEKLSVVGVGDSVMLGAVNSLYKQFPNGYFDAQVSRTAWVLNGILQDLNNKKLLGNPIVLNLGANGDCPVSCKEEIMKTVEDRKVFWINATNDSEVHVNDRLAEFAKSYDNLYIIDWASISKGHSEYFVVDGLHLTEVGKVAYTKAIYDSIYNVYLDEYNKKKEEIIMKHDEEQKAKISFYGNDILLNAYPYMQEVFNDAKYEINKDFNYENLVENLNKAIENEALNYKVVFAFDENAELTEDNYKSLVELCKNHEVYIIKKTKKAINVDNATIIDFYKEIENHNEYLMVDKVHLTEDGNKALNELLKSIIIKKS